mmetsp:Transcript_80853/g.216777  ORF Transcript_80853/g.216777 Transcript_80853/m.216777 type:complete len:216 (-) Transcript_80853:4403-5050(-)
MSNAHRTESLKDIVPMEVLAFSTHCRETLIKSTASCKLAPCSPGPRTPSRSCSCRKSLATCAVSARTGIEAASSSLVSGYTESRSGSGLQVAKIRHDVYASWVVEHSPSSISRKPMRRLRASCAGLPVISSRITGITDCPCSADWSARCSSIWERIFFPSASTCARWKRDDRVYTPTLSARPRTAPELLRSSRNLKSRYVLPVPVSPLRTTGITP